MLQFPTRSSKCIEAMSRGHKSPVKPYDTGVVLFPFPVRGACDPQRDIPTSFFNVLGNGTNLENDKRAAKSEQQESNTNAFSCTTERSSAVSQGSISGDDLFVDVFEHDVEIANELHRLLLDDFGITSLVEGKSVMSTVCLSNQVLDDILNDDIAVLPAIWEEGTC